jgi:hypothetical protein
MLTPTEEIRNMYKIWFEKPKGRDILQDTGIYGRIIQSKAS